jgi:hypothetical protein
MAVKRFVGSSPIASTQISQFKAIAFGGGKCCGPDDCPALVSAGVLFGCDSSRSPVPMNVAPSGSGLITRKSRHLHGTGANA